MSAFSLGLSNIYLEKIKSRSPQRSATPQRTKANALVNADKVSVYCLDPLYFRRNLSL